MRREVRTVVGRWSVPGIVVRERMSDPLEEALEEIRREPSPRRDGSAPMLDPSWTPAKGYGHASAILEALVRADESRFGDLVQEAR